MSAAAVVPLSLIVFRGAGLLDAAIEVESWITHCGVCDGAGYLYESTIQTAEAILDSLEEKTALPPATLIA